MFVKKMLANGRRLVFTLDHALVYGNVPKDLDRYFSVLKKCMNKFDCLVYRMLLIRELTPSLNV